MRLLSELMDNLTTTIRFVIAAFALCAFLLGLLTTVGMSHVGPMVAEEYGERAVELSERAIAEARAAERERQLAKEGWGYGAAAAGTGGIGADDGITGAQEGNAAGGWGAGLGEGAE